MNGSSRGELWPQDPPLSWSGSGGYYIDSSVRTFLFTLSNPAGNVAMMFSLAQAQNAIRCHDGMAMVPFSGMATTSVLWTKWREYEQSHEFCSGYTNHTGRASKQVFTGAEFFRAKEIEVIEIVGSIDQSTELIYLFWSEIWKCLWKIGLMRKEKRGESSITISLKEMSSEIKDVDSCSFRTQLRTGSTMFWHEPCECHRELWGVTHWKDICTFSFPSHQSPLPDFRDGDKSTWIFFLILISFKINEATMQKDPHRTQKQLLNPRSESHCPRV
jgi:hypothetical protein